MTPYSPLEIGEIIRANENVFSEVWEIIKDSQKDNLARGLLCEYTHNLAFDQAGWKYDKTVLTDPYDRKLELWQDDKLASCLSSTHTISKEEHFAWGKQVDDVIIHSFEESASEEFTYIYCGALSYRKIVDLNLIRPSKYDGGFWFNRHTACSKASA